jgi:hypothetical protein
MKNKVKQFAKQLQAAGKADDLAEKEKAKRLAEKAKKEATKKEGAKAKASSNKKSRTSSNTNSTAKATTTSRPSTAKSSSSANASQPSSQNKPSTGASSSSSPVATTVTNSPVQPLIQSPGQSQHNLNQDSVQVASPVLPEKKLTRLEKIQKKAFARMSSQTWRKQGLFGPPMVIKQNVSLNPHKFREDIKLLKKLGKKRLMRANIIQRRYQIAQEIG